MSTPNTVYFIAGGNRGIGFQLVKQLSEKPNTHVISSTRDITKPSELTKLACTSENVDVVSLDFLDEESISSLSSQLSKVASSGIDFFISSAALGEPESLRPILDVDSKTYIKHYKVNTLAPILILKQVFPFLQKRESKKIIFITSNAGSVGGFVPVSTSVYGHSKAALNHSARSLAFELKPQGFTTIVVHPGVVDTDMGNAAIAELTKVYPENTETFKSMRIQPKESARLQIELYDKLTKEDNDKFYNYDGTIGEY